MTGIQLVKLLALAGFAGAGAWLDWKRRRLPNALCAAAFACGLGLAVAGSGWLATGPALLHAALALAGGMVLFALGAIGGGDAKFYAALAGWFPLHEGARLLLLVSLCGLVLVLAMWPKWRRNDGEGVPMGVAIGGGAMLELLLVGR